MSKPADGTSLIFLRRTYPILDHFEYEHLPPALRMVSAQFHDLAWSTANNRPSDPETVECLRKLLEAKDCAVRAERGRTTNTTHP